MSKSTPLKILIVDDDDEFCELLQEILEEDDCEYFSADNGENALDICRKEDIDILITDINMPKMDGITLCRHIKEEELNIIPIVISGHGYLKQVIEAFSYNVFNFCNKPINFKDLKSVFHEALELCRLRKAVSGLVETLNDILGVDGGKVAFENMSTSSKRKVIEALRKKVRSSF